MIIKSEEYCTACKRDVKFNWGFDYKECDECGKKQGELVVHTANGNEKTEIKVVKSKGYCMACKSDVRFTWNSGRKECDKCGNEQGGLIIHTVNKAVDANEDSGMRTVCMILFLIIIGLIIAMVIMCTNGWAT